MKNWTRPKFKVQKFVPNSYVAYCYTNFISGEAWIEDTSRDHGWWDGGDEMKDAYNLNWPEPEGGVYKTDLMIGGAVAGFRRNPAYPDPYAMPEVEEHWAWLIVSQNGNPPQLLEIQSPSGNFYLLPPMATPQYVAMERNNHS